MPHHDLEYVAISPPQSILSSITTKTIPFREQVISPEGNYTSNWSYGIDKDGEIKEHGKFITFLHNDIQESEKSFGWKIHVGINDTEIGNLSLGWNIVKEILINHNVHYAKVVSPNYWLSYITGDQTVTGLAENTLAKKNPTQRNKQITIYCFMSPHIAAAEWKEIITEITVELARNSVEPAPFCGFGERAVPGSHYVTYRNDRGPDDSYYDISTICQNYNPCNELDELQDYIFDQPIEQPEYQSPEQKENVALKAEIEAMRLELAERDRTIRTQQGTINSLAKLAAPQKRPPPEPKSMRSTRNQGEQNLRKSSPQDLSVTSVPKTDNKNSRQEQKK